VKSSERGQNHSENLIMRKLSVGYGGGPEKKELPTKRKNRAPAFKKKNAWSKEIQSSRYSKRSGIGAEKEMKNLDARNPCRRPMGNKKGRGSS